MNKLYETYKYMIESALSLNDHAHECGVDSEIVDADTTSAES